MLSWALAFFVVAIAAAALGFSPVAGVTAALAQILFVVFLILTMVALIAAALRGRVPTPENLRAHEKCAGRQHQRLSSSTRDQANSSA